jgi:hypothetical protein
MERSAKEDSGRLREEPSWNTNGNYGSRQVAAPEDDLIFLSDY